MSQTTTNIKLSDRNIAIIVTDNDSNVVIHIKADHSKKFSTPEDSKIFDEEFTKLVSRFENDYRPLAIKNGISDQPNSWIYNTIDSK